MQEFTLILMLKVNDVLDSELCAVPIERRGDLLDRAFVTRDGGALTVRLFLTVPGELEDWEYEAFYDYYDAETFAGLGLNIEERPGGKNPVWEFSFPYVEDEGRLAAKINGVINLHGREADAVGEAVAGASEDYSGENRENIDTDTEDTDVV